MEVFFKLKGRRVTYLSILTTIIICILSFTFFFHYFFFNQPSIELSQIQLYTTKPNVVEIRYIFETFNYNTINYSISDILLNTIIKSTERPENFTLLPISNIQPIQNKQGSNYFQIVKELNEFENNTVRQKLLYR
jgi:hypothetical protein